MVSAASPGRSRHISEPAEFPQEWFKLTFPSYPFEVQAPVGWIGSRPYASRMPCEQFFHQPHASDAGNPIKAKIQTFQDAYNKLTADLKTQTAYNAATKVGGPLLGDGTVTGMQTMLRSLVGGNGPSGNSIGRLSDLGLEIQADGSLSTNSTKLDAALQDPVNVKAFFAAAGATATDNGIARRSYDFAFGALGVSGSITAHSAAFQKAIDQNNTTIDKFNTHIADYQKQLLAQYNAMDAQVAKLNSLGTFVSSQIAQWNKTS